MEVEAEKLETERKSRVKLSEEFGELEAKEEQLRQSNRHPDPGRGVTRSFTS